MFNHFFDNEVLPKSLTSFFVALIPKVESPLKMWNFCPIYLIGSLYKLVVKVLAIRLANVMVKLIALEQLTFY